MPRLFRNRPAWLALRVTLSLAAMAVLALGGGEQFLGAAQADVAPQAQRAALPASRPAAPVLPAAARKPTLPGVAVHTELPIREWLRPGEYAWHDEGVPAGPTTIVVNIRGRVLSAYRAGHEIGRSSIIYGADNKPTPTGTYPILAKKRHHISNLYGAPMPYMMRLTNDGVAIHAAEVADDLGTHGCIGIPDEFAALLFQAARVGDRVVIWRGDRLPG